MSMLRAAIEQLLGVEAPERAQYIRTMFDEVTRITQSLDVAGSNALDLGAMTVFLYCFPRTRGAAGYLRGGVRRAHAPDLLPARRCLPRPARSDAQVAESRWRKGKDLARMNRWREGSLLDYLDAFADDFFHRVDDYETLLTDNRIWKQRTVGIGVVSPERALQLGFVGPMLRGSGIEWDLRKKQPYARYREMDFDIPIGQWRLLRPLPGQSRGNAPVGEHHPAVRGLAARESGPVMLRNFKVASAESEPR
jgi:NADH-quinone oxidoreductase subunit D